MNIRILFHSSLINPIICLSIALFTSFYAQSQTPTIQDCLGAIPLCNSSYTELNSPIGSGNYPDETNYWNNIGGCYIEEDNSVWYTFNVSQSGLLEFEITPNDPYDDYDWMLFDLTNANCSDIYNDPSLVVSCNSFGLFFGQNGPTGISSNLGGIGNSNGPGDSNGPPFNADLPVTTGEQYALLISNHSGSTNGYQIDFMQNPGNAVIYDDIPPYIAQMSSIACETDSITIVFSEPVLCTSVSVLDFNLLSPSGSTIPISNLQSNNCINGANYGSSFTLYLNNNLIVPGQYQLILNTNNGSIEDACGNLSIEDTLIDEFDQLSLSTTNLNILGELCSQANAEITGLAITGGTPPYTSIWSNGSNTLDNIGLPGGTYQIHVSDSSSCPIDTSFLIPSIAGVTIDTSNLQILPDICSAGTGEILNLNYTGGTPPYTFQWKDSFGNIINTSSTTPNITNLTAGAYTLSIWDQNNCIDSISGVVPLQDGIQLDTSSMIITNDQCFQGIGAIEGITTNGVTPGEQFIWTFNNNIISYSNSSPDVYDLDEGQYMLIASDSNNCSDSILINISNESNLLLDSSNYSVNSDTCSNQIGSINGISVLGGTPPYSAIWTDQNGNIYPGALNPQNLEGGLQYSLYVSDSNGCDASALFFIPNEGFQDEFIITVNNASCNTNDGSLEIQMTTSTNSPFIFSIDNWNTTNASNSFENLPPGNHTLYIEDAYGCQSSQTILILQDSVPNAAFTASTLAGEAPVWIDFTNLSSNASSYNWMIDNNFFSTETNYSHHFNTAGNYLVTLVASNSPNCIDSISLNISILPDFRLYVPNAFTPDNDGINDNFEMVFEWEYPIKMDISIFNRWGQIVFEGSETNNIWDGKYNGIICQQDTYLYKIDYSYEGSINKNTITGHVMLIR